MVDKQASVYNILSGYNHFGTVVATRCYNDSKICSDSAAMSFDTNGNRLVPSGEVLDDDGKFLGYSTLANSYLPGEFNPIASCYDISIKGIANYSLNGSWYQQANMLNRSFRLKDCSPLYHFGSQDHPTANAYDQFYLDIAIGSDDERGLLYGNIAPYLDSDPDYIYQYKNRELESRVKLYAWLIVYFVAHNNIMEQHKNHQGYSAYIWSDVFLPSHYLYFKKKLGEFKGDYQFSSFWSSYYLSTKRSSICDKYYEHGDLDLRSFSTTITYDDLYPYHSDPRARYITEPDPPSYNFPGTWSSDPAVPLCDFSDMEIKVEANDQYADSIYNTYGRCTNCSRLGHAFVTQQPQYIFNIGAASGVLGFDWIFEDNWHYGRYSDIPYCNNAVPKGYSYEKLSRFNTWDYDNFFDITNRDGLNNGNYYGSLTDYIFLEISGVKSAQMANSSIPPSGSKHECYDSEDLNGTYELRSSQSMFDVVYGILTTANGVCCECEGSGCVTNFSVAINGDEYVYSRHDVKYYKSILTADIAGHTYEHDFGNIGDETTVVKGLFNIGRYAHAKPIDFNNKVIKPTLTKVDPEYSDVHDFSEASIKITFGDVDQFRCVPGTVACNVFADKIGPSDFQINIADNWINGEKTEETRWGTEIDYVARCGNVPIFGGDEQAECIWAYKGYLSLYPQYTTDAVNWCNRILGNFYLTHDNCCTWSYSDVSDDYNTRIVLTISAYEDTNQFEIELSITHSSLVGTACPETNVKFSKIIESLPGSQILDTNGIPMYRYYITENMVNGLQLPYSFSTGMVQWNGSPITLNVA